MGKIIVWDNGRSHSDHEICFLRVDAFPEAIDVELTIAILQFLNEYGKPLAVADHLDWRAPDQETTLEKLTENWDNDLTDSAGSWNTVAQRGAKVDIRVLEWVSKNHRRADARAISERLLSERSSPKAEPVPEPIDGAE